MDREWLIVWTCLALMAILVAFALAVVVHYTWQDPAVVGLLT